MMDHVAHRLEGQPPICIALLLGGLGQRIIKYLRPERKENFCGNGINSPSNLAVSQAPNPGSEMPVCFGINLGRDNDTNGPAFKAALLTGS